MTTFRAFYDRMEFIVEYHLDRIGVAARDDSGAVSTETAVLTAALVAIAAAGGLILFNKMRTNASSIPDVVQAPGG